MKFYSRTLFGLIAFEEDLQGWWDNGTEGAGTDDFVSEPVRLDDVDDCLEKGSCACFYGADGTLCKISDDGVGDESDIDIKGADFVILECENYPDLFKAAYPNKAAAIEELKSNYAEILPSDFDFENRSTCYRGIVLC